MSTISGEEANTMLGSTLKKSASTEPFTTLPPGKKSLDQTSESSSSSASSSESNSSSSSSSPSTPSVSPSKLRLKKSSKKDPPTTSDGQRPPQPTLLLEKRDHTEAAFRQYLDGKENGLSGKIRRAKQRITTGRKMSMAQKVKDGEAKVEAPSSDRTSASTTGAQTVAPSVVAAETSKDVLNKKAIAEDRKTTSTAPSASAESEITTTKGPEEPSIANIAKLTNSSNKLTDSEKSMYASERLDNFRWLSKVAGRYAECPPLTEQDLVEESIAKEVSEAGQFAELAYSTVEIKSLFDNHAALKDEKILLDYPVLGECDFVDKIFGAKMDLTAFVVFRRSTKQLVVSISGSSNLKHAIQNLRAVRMAWRPGSVSERLAVKGGAAENPIAVEEEEVPPDAAVNDGKKDEDLFGRVHTGFFTLYRDVKEGLFGAIRKGMKAHTPEELVLTGHSMGGSVAYLLCMDLLSSVQDDQVKDTKEVSVTLPKKLCLTTFGIPRTGNAALVSHFSKLVKEFVGKTKDNLFREYSVKAFNDGVPAVPPRTLGYVHFCERPFYAFRRKLYRIPEGQGEFSLFRVSVPDSASGKTSEKPSDTVAPTSPSFTIDEIDGSTLRSPVSKDVLGDWLEIQPGQASQPSISVAAETTNSFPRGGHNYYSGRDLEAFRRATDRLHAAGFPGPKWEIRLGGGKRRSAGNR